MAVTRRGEKEVRAFSELMIQKITSCQARIVAADVSLSGVVRQLRSEVRDG